MSLPSELRAALENLRKTRSERPAGDYDPESYAAWRDRIADALESLSTVLLYDEDRRKAIAESIAARSEAAKIRAELDGPT
ncbi:hypothetical protein [Micromonospora sp. HM5-17]|jgi:hypothetical protein|uniref:hypothetical protein n=1 Tax=Micromonospora sp. HM5-17 TaxID=2487710 RepID=UPI0011CE2863|nr:hypothetical protein [Micromonospora sp. HM5-17]